jgi:hypothetical protein
MARKRRALSPAPAKPPPPPLPQESGTDPEEEEVPRRAAASHNPLQNPQLQALAAAADSSEDSDSDGDAQAFQMLPVPRLAANPAALAPQLGSDADEEEEDGESEPEVPEPVQKKAAAETKTSKTAEPEDKKRPAPEPALSGRAKKAKKRPAPEPAPSGKASPQATPAGNTKKPGGKGDKSRLDSPPPSSKSEKPARAHRPWSKEDSIRILETLAAHVKCEGVVPNTNVLLAAVRDHLDRNDCSQSDLYERVRRLKERYEKAVSSGVVPSGEDELQMYNLSYAIWGQNAKEAITAAASKNGSTVTKSKKGHANREKINGNSKGGTQMEVADQNGDAQKGGKKGQDFNGEADKDVKGKLSKVDTTTGTLRKTKKQGNDKGELGKSAKSGTTKETATTATQDGDALTKRKRGTTKETATTATQDGDALMKRKRGKMDIDHMPKEASIGRQNGGAQTEEETHQEETEIEATVQGTHRSSDELHNLYPNLSWCVDRIEAQHPCGKSLKRAFQFIHDEKADALESKIKTQRISEVKVQIRRGDVEREILNLLISLD